MSEIKKEEKVHAKILHSMTENDQPQAKLEAIFKREKWHAGHSGGWIGQAVYGANDGLGAVFGIVTGMAGYTGGSHVVWVAGVAGTLASALSMGSGAYLARKSEREVYEAELENERREIEENPEEEKQELELFYQLKGFTPEESAMMAQRLTENPDQFLKTLAHEELGLSASSFPNPVKGSILRNGCDGRRRNYSGHSLHVLLRNGRHHSQPYHQHAGAFSRRSVEDDRHGTQLVAKRIGNDVGRFADRRDRIRRRRLAKPRMYIWRHDGLILLHD